MMMQKVFVVGLLLGLTGCTLIKRDEEKERNNNKNSDLFMQAAFLAPANDFRSVPFYALNDELEPAEVARQIRGFKEGGFGGFFFTVASGCSPTISETVGLRL